MTAKNEPDQIRRRTQGRRGIERAGNVSESSGDTLKLQSPIIVPMSEEQFERAASTLAELLLWAWEQERDERPAA
jgi:hypothetical protein